MPRRPVIPTFVEDEEDVSNSCCTSLLRPVEVGDMNKPEIENSAFCLPPFFGPLIFDNETSDCRDHCANERTFLSYLRLSIYMAIVSVAITLSFHLRKTATEIELRMAKPLGAIFWALSVACLGVGVGNYINTVNKYSRRAAIVQTGWKTQSVMAMVALSIVGSCFTLLVINKLNERPDAMAVAQRFLAAFTITL
ncbi:hypothetical protein QBC34DRAFT_290333 [Podospora aff. communis PSN243]|uniref:DUF202 domain-containing protein n=1 Tax=Podospora aff. communis PSN243 TaxID=3040156 RepID=A0AAV9H1U5_9PEZI|nr:hypothetical protein QBC34DRAFT_290333 [Podospora aff. communis PSN243]